MNSGAYLRKHRTRYCGVAGQRQRSYRGDAVLSHARAIGLRLGGVAGAAAAWRTRHSAHAEDLTVRRAVVLIYATAVAYFLRALELRVAGRATLEAATALTVRLAWAAA